MCQWQVKIMLLDQKQELDLMLSADGLNQAKQQALKEFKKRSPQRKYLYLEAKQPGVYTIVSNMDDVGEVTLQRVDS